MNYKYASRMSNLAAGPIANILKVAGKPGIISLAGGLPSPETFPRNAIKQITSNIFEKYGNKIFQYGTSEGLMELREAVANYVSKKDIQCESENVLIFTGAQSALNTIAMLFLDKDNSVAIESPTFLAAVKAFKAYEPNIISLDMDDEGIIPESYETALKNSSLRFTYIIPNFQNPTGQTMSLSRRKLIADLAKKYNSLILEDDPYYELRMKGENLPSLYSLAPENVIHVGSLSKVLSPGLRIGYCICNEEIIHNLCSLKQCIDVHTDHLAQAIAAEYISQGYLESQLEKITQIYSPRLECMASSIKEYMPEIKFVYPEGGMFVWLKFNKNIDTEDFYDECISKGVAFVPGKFFFADTPQADTMRLNFTNVDESNIKKGIKTISEVFRTL